MKITVLMGSPNKKGSTSILTEEFVRKERMEVLDCGPDEIRGLAGHIEAFLAEDCLCVVGNDEKIKSEAERFDRIENLK